MLYIYESNKNLARTKVNSNLFVMDDSSRPVRRQRAGRQQADLLSNLSDDLLVTILSFLPTRIAALTSVLCRRFRHLWKASPSVHLDLTADSARVINFENSRFLAMATRALLSRQLSDGPVLSLRLDLNNSSLLLPDLPGSFLCSLLIKARSLGLLHLTIVSMKNIQPILPTIFSIHSLLSLHLTNVIPSFRVPNVIPPTPSTVCSVVTLTQLQSLSLALKAADSAEFNQLLSQLPSLQHLKLWLIFSGVFPLSSQTIRKLELDTIFIHQAELLALSTPSLEILHLKITQHYQRLPHIEGDMPFLRKATIILHGLHKGDRFCTGDVVAVAHLLNCVSITQELNLDIMETQNGKYPFPVLLEPGKEVPNFPNLKHLDANMYFHKYNFESIIALLHHSPALESLKLVHKAPAYWRSKLPRNAAGNNKYIHLTNLHLGQNSKEFMKLVSKKGTHK
ncbi:hypothetical protein LUZ63_012943 [Rhynchospora breviuscula]|uniref:F-box domain-containing protein n=1 Tax=Rhynchospora breviuscula TaxID=2022672 RepID=A0A9Q0C7N7_9POAL|nr:hypothetical protein LUZ63_012943 [Rhynchospora breviuscula]